MTQYQQLINNLEYLKLNELVIHLLTEIDLITSNNKTFVEGLLSLTNKEIEKREKSMIYSMVRTGAFPHTKTLDDFEFSFQPDINEMQIREFTNHKFIELNENIVFLGSPGLCITLITSTLFINFNLIKDSTLLIFRNIHFTQNGLNFNNRGYIFNE